LLAYSLDCLQLAIVGSQAHARIIFRDGKQPCASFRSSSSRLFQLPFNRLLVSVVQSLPRNRYAPVLVHGMVTRPSVFEGVWEEKRGFGLTGTRGPQPCFVSMSSSSSQYGSVHTGFFLSVLSSQQRRVRSDGRWPDLDCLVPRGVVTGRVCDFSSCLD